VGDVTDLVAWLREQIDEDEWAWQMVAARDVVEMLHGEPLAPRMLAEVAAKRAILDGCEETLAGEDSWDPMIEGGSGEEFVLAKFVIRQLAQPFAGRPGWREEWAR